MMLQSLVPTHASLGIESSVEGFRIDASPFDWSLDLWNPTMNQSCETEATPQRAVELTECYFDLLATGQFVRVEDFCRRYQPIAEELRQLIGSAKGHIAFVSRG